MLQLKLEKVKKKAILIIKILEHLKEFNAWQMTKENITKVYKILHEIEKLNREALKDNREIHGINCYLLVERNGISRLDLDVLLTKYPSARNTTFLPFSLLQLPIHLP